jgi:hypothetical protein
MWTSWCSVTPLGAQSVHENEDARGSHYAVRNMARYGKDLRSSFNNAVIFCVVCAATIALAILVH